MGSDTIPDRSGGQTIIADMFNLIKRVLAGNLVPRNSSGVAEHEAGNIGTDTYRFLTGFFTKLNIGATGSTKTIEEDGDDIIFKFNGTEKAAIKANGLDHQLSSSSGNYFGQGDVTNLEISLTTRGRPVFIALVHDGTNGNGDVQALGAIRFKRDSTYLTRYAVSSTYLPCSSFCHIDVVSAGTYTYKLYVEGTDSWVQYAKLIAYEL